MRFSLVLCTINRVQEIDRLFHSLSAQGHQDFDVVLVDQNPDDRLLALLKAHPNLNIQHLKSAPGLSRARNVGLKAATGDILAFPDDDCWYLPDTLERVLKLFEQHPEAAVVTGQAINGNGVPVANLWDNVQGWCDVFNVWHRAISFTVFARKSYFEAVPTFDENLGVGSGTPFGSGEETDFLLSGLKKNQQIYYAPDLKIHHPDPVGPFGDGVQKRALGYGRGLGYVLEKHGYPLWYKGRVLLRPLVGALLGVVQGKKGKVAFYFYTFKGRLEGMQGYSTWSKNNHDHTV